MAEEYQCDDCGAEFHTEEALEEHRTEEHEREESRRP